MPELHGTKWTRGLGMTPLAEFSRGRRVGPSSTSTATATTRVGPDPGEPSGSGCDPVLDVDVAHEPPENAGVPDPVAASRGVGAVVELPQHQPDETRYSGLWGRLRASFEETVTTVRKRSVPTAPPRP